MKYRKTEECMNCFRDLQKDCKKSFWNSAWAVDDQVKGLSAEYAIATAQCLMRAEATKSDDYKEIYSAWITNLRSKGVF